MGRPVDRIKGVVLVTDYGALDSALRLRDRREKENQEKLNQNSESNG